MYLNLTQRRMVAYFQITSKFNRIDYGMFAIDCQRVTKQLQYCMTSRITNNEPENDAYYYHYKHDPKKGVFDHAYVVIGVGVHTENETQFVIYKPLYTSPYLLSHKGQFFIRPYSHFIGYVDTAGYSGPRFIRITDKNIIKTLSSDDTQ